ncbi:hypothetical protein Scep_006900 [Stephania cephalantha]|uniref:Uncharacterized protein n=1 Tax=Stephania cephalantha TaxID=152367 RepID=A0AAP0KAJ9_9MAGN
MIARYQYNTLTLWRNVHHTRRLNIPVVCKVVAVKNFGRYIDESLPKAIKIVYNLLGITIDEAKEEVNYTRSLTM